MMNHDDLLASINRELDWNDYVRAPEPPPSRRDLVVVFLARQVLRLASPTAQRKISAAILRGVVGYPRIPM